MPHGAASLNGWGTGTLRSPTRDDAIGGMEHGMFEQLDEFLVGLVTNAGQS